MVAKGFILVGVVFPEFSMGPQLEPYERGTIAYVHSLKTGSSIKMTSDYISGQGRSYRCHLSGHLQGL